MSEDLFMTPGQATAAAPGLMQKATAILPVAVKYMPKNPAFMLGAAAVGLVGFLAWKNREKIAGVARPMIMNAAEKANDMRERMPFMKPAADNGMAANTMH